MADTERFAAVENVALDEIDSLGPVVRPTLVVAHRDGLPIAQEWLEPGERPGAAFCARARAHLPPSAGIEGRDTIRSVSVVICTRDRPEELRRCLASFSEQSRRPDEVIVVDNASIGEETRRVAEKAGVRYLREDRPGLDFARNTGATAASGEIVAYTDDDTELHVDWIANLVLAFERPDVMAMTGLVLPASLRTQAQWLFEKQWSFGRGYHRIDFDSAFYKAHRSHGCPAWIIGAGANMAFRREIFERIGLFDERLDVGQAGCSGDSEYWYRVLAAGYVCRYEPTAVVRHHHRLAMNSLADQIYHYMRGHTAALMVQYERTGDLGNLRRAFLTMPIYYARRALGRLLRGRTPANWFLREQAMGAAAGILFYWRAAKPAYRPLERSPS